MKSTIFQDEAVQSGRSLPTFQKNMLPSSSGLKSKSRKQADFTYSLGLSLDSQA
jgi:hypothetical protein